MGRMRSRSRSRRGEGRNTVRGASWRVDGKWRRWLSRWLRQALMGGS
jgi:hypothetical protein